MINRTFSLCAGFGWALAAVILLVCGCSLAPMGGGGTEGGNVTGILLNSDGTAGVMAVVELVPADFNSIENSVGREKIMVDTTDSNGAYSFSRIANGTYTITALQLTKRTRAIIADIPVAQGSATVETHVLARPGVLRITLPDSIDRAHGYVYVPGTEFGRFCADEGPVIVIDSIPAGVLPSIVYGNTLSPIQQVLRKDITMTPGDTVQINLPGWLYCKKLALNTTPQGADVSGTVTGFPVLVRLTNANFDFSLAKADGGDLRFAKSDGTPLGCEIERWDAGTGVAEVWVRVDTVRGNDSTQRIMIYYGNSTAPAMSSGPAVFDTAAGFQGVWHLNEPGNTAAGGYKDATVNGYNCTGINRGPDSRVTGACGNAQKFIDTSSSISGPCPARIKGSSSFTVSFWMNYSATATRAWIVYFGAPAVNRSCDFLLNPGLPGQFGLFDSGSIGESNKQNMFDAASYRNKWSYVVTEYDASTSILSTYINGSLINAKTIPAPDIDPAGGLHISQPGDYSQHDVGYNGLLDELRICSTVESYDRIKLNYMNQKEVDGLVQFK